MAESSVTLPAACVVATLLWWLPAGSYSTAYLFGWLACALTTYVIIELTAQNALLRVRSRMVSSALLLSMAACGFLHPLQTGTVALLCVALSFFCLLRTYDAPRPELDTMHAFLWLSLGSLLWPSLLLLSIVQLWNQTVYLRHLTMRCLGASLIGILLPYAFWATGAFALGDIMPFVSHATAVISPFTEPFYWRWVVEVLQTSGWDGFVACAAQRLTPVASRHPAELAALAFVLLTGLTGFVHYVRKSYDDKILVRMCHYSMLAMQVVVAVWMALQPQQFYVLFPLLIVTGIFGIAHFIALTHTWWSNAWVIVLLFLLIVVGVCTLALPLILRWPQHASDLDFTFIDRYLLSLL